MNEYVNLLKKYGSIFKDKEFISKVMEVEEEICLNLFKKNRTDITGTEEEIILVTTIKEQLLKDFPEVTEDMLRNSKNSIFHNEHERYYKNIIKL